MRLSGYRYNFNQPKRKNFVTRFVKSLYYANKPIEYGKTSYVFRLKPEESKFKRFMRKLFNI